jgi:uncharacterized protein (DUF2249 family)
MKTLDICRVGLAERNTLATRNYAQLADGDALEVITDSPPWVVYHQLQTEHFDRFAWEVIERGPERFVVRITKRAS